jgi:hypothetical protein
MSMTPFALPEISTATKLGLLGDTHGNLPFALEAIASFKALGVSTVVQLGDFGFVWPESKSGRNLDRLSKALGERQMALYFLDGNHEAFDRLLRFPLNSDGTRVIRGDIRHLPRGYRTTLSDGRTVAVLGGAGSVDRGYRKPGKSWWADEAITEQDLRALGTDHADVLLSHEAPSPVPAVDAALAGSGFPIEDIVYAEGVRAMLTRGFMAVRPSLVLHGHHHVFHDSTEIFGLGESAFESRVIGLDRDLPKRPSLAVLDVQNNEIRFYTSAGKPAGE